MLADVLATRPSVYTVLAGSDGEDVTALGRNEEFLQAIGIMTPLTKGQVFLSDADESAAVGFFAEHGLDPVACVALYAGGQTSARDCGACGEALADICTRRGMSVVLLGTDTNRAINAANAEVLVAHGVGVVDMTGMTSVTLACAIVKHCALAVGADTGLAHVAAACGVPNVTIVPGCHFGHFLPYDKSSSVVCVPLSCYGCGEHCAYGMMHCVKAARAQTIARACRDALSAPCDRPRVYAQGPEHFCAISGGPTLARADGYFKGRAVKYIAVGGEITTEATRTAQTNLARLHDAIVAIQKDPADRVAYQEASEILVALGKPETAKRLEGICAR
jgi:hypothetical protein